MAQKSYIEVDLGWREIKAGLKQLNNQSVDIGLYAEDIYPDRPERDAAQVAFWNEYGTEDGHVPARPFMREAFDRNESFLNGLAEQEVSDLYAYKGSHNYKTILENIGLAFTQMVQYVLLEGPWTPNAPKTVANKGHDTPLIDTTFLWDSIKYKLSKLMGVSE